MEDQFQEIPHVFNPSRPQKSLPKRTIVLIAVIVLILISVVFIKLSSSKKQSVPSSATPSQSSVSFSPMPTISSSPSSSESPSPTSVPSVNPVDKTTGLDRSKLSVVVENGSGGAGAAGKAADYLKGLGYNIISTANADSFSYSNVVIQIKEAKSDYLDLLKKDLGFNYTVGSTSADLSSGASEDALVIIGQ